MFRADLLARLERIFGFSATLSAPDYRAPEQGRIFVEINNVQARMSTANGGRQTAIVSGVAIVFSQDSRLPFGFFRKRLEKAKPEDAQSLFFSTEVDVSDSPARERNIHERRAAFQFLYDSQYDPDRGALTGITFSLTEE